MADDIFSSMFLSIVVPTCNRPEALIDCLNRLEPRVQGISSASYEVVVSDDSTSEETKEMLHSRYAWVRWKQGPRRGPAANRNSGASAAKGKWLIFTDDDCLPEPGWVKNYLDAFEKHGDFKLFEGRTSPSDSRTRIDQEAPINETGGFLWSCNFAVLRESFFALNGFDENFPAPAMEDVDFYTRAKKRGIVSKFVGEAVVKHPWRLRRGRKFAIQHGKSLGRYLYKHPEKRKVFIRTLPLNVLRALKRTCKAAVVLRTTKGFFVSLEAELLSYASAVRFLIVYKNS